MIKSLVFLLLVAMLLPGVSGLIWSNNTFNNSLQNENLTFIGNQNLTRYLTIPNSVSILTNGFIRLSAFPSSNFSMAHFYKFNETNGSDATDILSGNNLINQGNVNFSLDSIVDESAATVSAVSWFNRSSAFVDFGNRSFSVSVWFKTNFDCDSDWCPIMQNSWTIGTGLGWFVAISNRDVYLRFRDGGGINDIETSASAIDYADNQWHHIIFSKNDSGFTVAYVDGVHIGNFTRAVNVTSFDVATARREFEVGRAVQDNKGFAGFIDELAIWNTSISANNFTTIYNFGLGGFQPNENVTNTYLDVGDNIGKEWNFTYEFNQQNNRTENLATIINSFLNSTYLVGSNYVIPFVFHSDTSGDLEYSSMSFDNEGFLENSQGFNTQTYDTSRETFSINISFDSERYTDVSGTLVYNGTRTTGTEEGNGNIRVFIARSDIPIVTSQQNHTFYWEISMTDSSGQQILNSTFNNQTVDQSTFIQCGAGEMAVNYTTYDEEGQTLLITNFDATFTWRLNSSSAVSKNSSFSLSGANTYQFCINNNNTYFTDSNINLNEENHTERAFGFNDQLFTNDTTHQSLYLLNSSLGTNVIIKLKDVGLLPLAGHTIQIFRKLESGSEILVENDITDDLGQMVARLIENEVKYRLLFFDSGNTLVKTIENVIVACTTTICQQIFVVQELTGALDEFDDIPSYSYTLSFNNNTDTFSFVWVDNTGDSQTHRFLVEKITFENGTEVVFNSTSTVDSDVLSYTTDGSSANYRATAFRKVGNDEDRIDVLNVDVGNNFGTFSFEGLYWSFVLFMLFLLIGRFYPPVGIVLYLFGAFMLGILDIVFINPAIMIAEIVIGVLFIWAFRG